MKNSVILSSWHPVFSKPHPLTLPYEWKNKVDKYIQTLATPTQKSRKCYFFVIGCIALLALFFNLWNILVEESLDSTRYKSFISSIAENYAAELSSIIIVIVLIDWIVAWREDTRKKLINVVTLEKLRKIIFEDVIFYLACGFGYKTSNDNILSFRESWDFILNASPINPKNINENCIAYLTFLHFVTTTNSSDRETVLECFTKLDTDIEALENSRAGICSQDVTMHLILCREKLNWVIYDLHGFEKTLEDKTEEQDLVPGIFDIFYEKYIDFLVTCLATEQMLPSK